MRWFGTDGILSSSSASSSSIVMSSSSSFSFCTSRQLLHSFFQIFNSRGRVRTVLALSSSSYLSSRWCSRLNLLILSWSSRLTSTSSPTACSSSFVSCMPETWSVIAHGIRKNEPQSYHSSLHLDGFCGVVLRKGEAAEASSLGAAALAPKSKAL